MDKHPARAFIAPVQAVLYILKRLYISFRYNDLTIAKKFRKDGARVGENCFIQIRNLGSEPYLIEIGNNVSIAYGVDLLTHDGASVIFREEMPYLRFFGKIVIEDNCFIGAGAIIAAGVRIGKNSIIGPHAIVINNVKPGSIMMGNPAIRVSTVDKYREKCLEQWSKQGLPKFEPLFEGRNKYEVQRIMRTKKFREQLKQHLSSLNFETSAEVSTPASEKPQS